MLASGQEPNALCAGGRSRLGASGLGGTRAVPKVGGGIRRVDGASNPNGRRGGAKKKRHTVQTERYQETEAFLKVFGQRLAQGETLSCEWLETTLRAALLQDGRRLLENLLAQLPQPSPPPQLGQRVYRQRPSEILSVFGLITLRRDYYHKPGAPGDQGGGEFPLDRALGVLDHCTPAAVRLICRTAAQLPYVESSQQLAELAGLPVEPSRIQRLVLPVGAAKQDRVRCLPAPTTAAPEFYVSSDGTGVPMIPPELAGRTGRGADGQAKTREVKLAAFFTRTHVDAEGRPVRNPDRTTYLASFAGSDEFGPLARQAALGRGLAESTRVLFLADGAAWTWEIARTCFPQAIQILDFYHASEHVVTLAQAVYADSGTARNWALRWQALIYESELDTVLTEARTAAGANLSPEGGRQVNYLENHRSRMDYRRYRANGWFIGSGIVEAGCKHVVGQRLKQSGMF
jgi:hypothetical protein